MSAGAAKSRGYLPEILAVTAGLLIISLALWVRGRTPPHLDNSRSAMGRIVKVDRGILKRNYTIEFQHENRTYEFQVRGYYRQYAVGRGVSVLYDGDAPSNACLNRFFITRGRFYLAGGVGLLLIMIAGYRLLRSRTGSADTR